MINLSTWYKNVSLLFDNSFALTSNSLTGDAAPASENSPTRSSFSTRYSGPLPVRSGVRLFSELWQRQPVLASFALVLLLAMLPTLLAMHLDLRTLNGISVWMKPAKFLFSLAVYYATLAWFFGYLPPQAPRTRAGRFVIWGSIAVGLFEMLWLIAAAVGGVAAHFNRESLVWIVAYGTAGAGATTLLVAMLIQGRMIARATVDGARQAISPQFRAALVAGVWIAFIGTLVTAFTLSSGTAHWVGGTQSDAAGLALLGWSRDGGDLRVAHFWALHAHQVLPVMFWLLSEKLQLVRGMLAVRVLAALYVAFIGFTFVQALMGQPFLG